MRQDNYMLKEALSRQKLQYTKTYKTVMTALIISIYAYGYFQSLGEL